VDPIKVVAPSSTILGNFASTKLYQKKEMKFNRIHKVSMSLGKYLIKLKTTFLASTICFTHSLGRHFNGGNKDHKHHHSSGMGDPSHELLGLKEALEMSHLPRAHDHQDARLADGPPQHALVCAFACLTKALLTILK
jgi:hypothetical protein